MNNKTILASILILFLLAGCKPKTESGSAESPDNKEFVIVASNYPLLYFAERLAGNMAKFEFPASVSTDPAHWQPTSADITALQQADLILLNGATYEKWIDMVSLPASKTVNTTAGLEDRFIEMEGSITHSHGPGGEHEHGETGMTTWLDLSLAIEQAAVVRDALAQRLPGEEDRLSEAFGQLKSELEMMDREIKEISSSNHDLYVIFSHPVYQYFQRRYHVHGTSLHWEPDVMPDDDQWKELQEILKKHPKAVMVWEDVPMDEIGNKLEATGMNFAVFNPCGNRPGEGDLLSVMSANIESLRNLY